MGDSDWRRLGSVWLLWAGEAETLADVGVTAPPQE
jgi:hypothetical protein